MSTGKRPARKAAVPSALSVPRMRAIRCNEIAEPVEVVETNPMRPRRNRKPKFVF